MKKLGIYCLIAFALTACLEPDDDDGTPEVSYTFSGHLYKNCEKEPISNEELNFYKVRLNFSSIEEKFYQQTITDSNGYFFIEHDNKDFNYLEVLNRSGQKLFAYEFIPDELLRNPSQTANLYSRTKLSHPVKILTDKPYTAKDTLFVEVRGNYNPVLALSGPFINNQIGQTDLMDFSILTDKIVPFSSRIEVGVLVYWCIGRENLVINNTTTPGFTTNTIKDLPQRLCDGDMIVIDMR